MHDERQCGRGQTPRDWKGDIMVSFNERMSVGWLRLSCLGLLALACGGEDPTGPRGAGAGEEANVLILGQVAELPNCNVLRRGQVYYVTSQDQFYVCDGGEMVALETTDGSPLVRIEDEAPGDNCETGGSVVHVGSDLDGDGELDQGEVTSTDYVCGPKLVAQSMFIDEQEEVEALRGVFWVVGNVQLSGDLELSALQSLQKIDGVLGIQNNQVLTNLDMLSNLTSVKGNLSISDNDALANIDGLSGLTNLEGSLSLIRNDALTNVDGFANLSGVGLLLELSDLDSLTNLDGLSGLGDVSGSLSITDNDVLASLSGLSNLTSVGFSLEVSRNPSLVDLSGLEALASVGSLALSQNDALTSLRALSALEEVGDLNIFNHANLPACEVTWLIDNIDSLGNVGNISDNNGTASCP